MTLLSRLVDEAAMRRPEAPAVRCDGETLSYGELARRSHGLARVLLGAGLEPRDRVAVLLGKGLDVPVAFHGALASGGALVPIDPGSPVDQIVRILRATGARHLVTEPGRRDAVRETLASCPEISSVVGLEEADDLPLRPIPWSSVSEQATDRPPETGTIDLDPAYILHTSGSTGTPKLILHTHRSALAFADWAADEYSLRPDDRLSNHSSHHTCFATFDFYAAARAGAATVVPTPATLKMPASLAALLERERVTVWYSVPTALVHLSLRGGLEDGDLSSLRWVLFAGETFPAKHLARLRRQLPAARFSHVYGSTEVNVCTRYHLPEGVEPAEPLPIGTACSTSATLVVGDDLEPLPDGETGELLVRGSTVMAGYWGDPAANRRALVRRPTAGGFDDLYFRTGDRVRRLDDGNLAFVTRADLQVKVRGHRVELEGVERALRSLDPIEEAAAIALPDGEGSSVIHAVVVTDDPAASPRKILDDLAGLLPTYAVPAEVVILPSLPRTPTGKVDRTALRFRLLPEETHHAH